MTSKPSLEVARSILADTRETMREAAREDANNAFVGAAIDVVLASLPSEDALRGIAGWLEVAMGEGQSGADDEASRAADAWILAHGSAVLPNWIYRDLARAADVDRLRAQNDWRFPVRPDVAPASPRALTPAGRRDRSPRMADPTQLDRIEALLIDVRALVRTTLSQELQMANVLDPIAAQVASLVTEVANETTVNQSAITLLNGLSAQIAQLAANAADPAQVSSLAGQLGALATSVQNNAAALAAAVTANTSTPPTV